MYTLLSEIPQIRCGAKDLGVALTVGEKGVALIVGETAASHLTPLHTPDFNTLYLS